MICADMGGRESSRADCGTPCKVESGDPSESVAAVQDLPAIRACFPRASALDCGDEACAVTALTEVAAPKHGRFLRSRTAVNPAFRVMAERRARSSGGT